MQNVNAQKMIESRRRQDEKFRDMDNVIASDRKTLLMANFETSTTSKIERRQKKETFEQMKGELEMALHDRRQELANLYNEEMDLWRSMVMSRVETQEDRKQRIKERAYALKEAREEARQKHVKVAYNNQWRDACDDARTLDSKAMTKFMQRERVAQIEEKKKKKEKLTIEENAFLEDWKKQLALVEERDMKKRESHRQADQDNFKGIISQIDEKNRMKENFFQKTKQEDEEEIDYIRYQIEAENEKQRLKREEEYLRGREIFEYNEQYKHYKAEEQGVEREHEKILLDYAMRKEREALQAEELKRNASKEAARQFRKYLEEQMIKEAEDTAFVDEVRKREEEKVWKARDDALQLRDDARRFLMKAVDEGRQEQIKARGEYEVLEREQGKVFANKFLEDAREGVAKEQAESARRRGVAMENRGRLQEQMAVREEAREQGKQEVYLEDKHMKYVEKMHQQKLTEQGGALRLHRPLQKNSWYT